MAIKVLARASGRQWRRRRFSARGAGRGRRLHENVIAIHRVDQSQELPYLVMPYIAGVSLQKRIDREGPLPLAAILRIARQVFTQPDWLPHALKG